MSTQMWFRPYHPQNPEAPKLAEITSAAIMFKGAFLDVTAALKYATKAAAEMEAEESTRLLYEDYETSGSFTIEYPVTRRENRQVITRLARVLRRPALIHKGRKP